ncbi:MAG TPA: DMT family transporter [Burkholderiaceae bacterium]
MPSTAYALIAIALWTTLASLGTSLSHLPPFLLTGLALIIGSVPSWPLVLRDRGAWKVPPRTLALGIYGLFGYHFLLFIALRYAPPVEANLVNYLWPLLMVVLAPVLLPGVSLRPLHLVAGLLGFGGAAAARFGGRRRRRAPGLQQQRGAVLQRQCRGLRLLHALCEVARQRVQLRRTGRSALGAAGPCGLRGVEHQAHGAVPARAEVVPVARRHHLRLARGDAGASAFHLDLEHTVQADQHLEMVVRVAAVRVAVVAQGQGVRGGRVHGRTRGRENAIVRRRTAAVTPAAAAAPMLRRRPGTEC